MAKNWNREFAFYAASLYRIGNYTDATLVSAIMFEKAIKETFKKEKMEYPDSYSALSDAITELGNKYPSKYNKKQLHKIRKNIRNNIIHGSIDLDKINPNIIKIMVVLTWEMLDRVRFLKYGKTAEKIDFLTADYHVIRMKEYFNKQLSDEQAKRKSFVQFDLTDFEELYLMRNKMFSLASKIEKDILQIKYKGNIKIDLISKVDTTSAYVWMPMHAYNEKGEKLTSASASILATPLDFRIYLDIGGGTHQERKDYYAYLLSTDFKKLIDSNTLEGLEYFDIDWYCFITESNYIKNYSDIEIQSKIDRALEKLDKYEDKIITWNKLLVGFIIERGTITFDNIQEKLEFILKLYSDFKAFQINNKKGK